MWISIWVSVFFFFKQKTAYEMCGRDWSSDVCSSDLANFLQVAPDPTFDAVVMNPPFYGKHWLKHLSHAMQFLKPGGRLVCILPATAHYDHDEAVGDWRDLPVGSFASSGTNVPTGYCIYWKPRE